MSNLITIVRAVTNWSEVGKNTPRNFSLSSASRNQSRLKGSYTMRRIISTATATALTAAFFVATSASASAGVIWPW